MKKTSKTRRTALLAACALLLALLPQSVSAGEETAVRGAPIAQNMEIETYRGIPFTGTLRATDAEGDGITFTVVSMPKKGTLVLAEDGVTFCYTPGQDKGGRDQFTYTATDSEGNTSKTASVKIAIRRAASGVTYQDMADNAAYTAAVDLAERGVFVGAQVGDVYFFEPERPVSRGEFIAMAVSASGQKVSEVTMTGFCDDAEIPAWAKSTAVSALRSGIVRGVSTESGVAYRAGDPITLNEAAAVLDRVLSVTDVDPGELADGNEAWCAQAVANLESVRVIETGRFSPDDLRRGITRAEAAELLSAAMTLLEQKQDGGFWSRLFG